MADSRVLQRKIKNAIFGVAGFPPAFWSSPFKKDRLNGPEWLNLIGLDLLELQMTYGPRMSEDNARAFSDRAKEYGIRLTVHASYFIVLTTSDESKIDRSYKTLEKTCHLAGLCGAKRIILHPGSAFDSREKSLDLFIKRLSHFCKNFLPEGMHIYPESCGKRNQLGSLDEILEICQSVDGARPCIDFGHLRAFSRGGLETPASIRAVFEEVERILGNGASANCHLHITPMEYTQGGEKQHRAYGEIDPGPKQLQFFANNASRPYYPMPEHLAQVLAEKDIPAWVVSECHDSQEKGALAMKETYRKFMGKQKNQVSGKPRPGKRKAI
jgi:deoxyribonuclease-4